MFHLILWQSPLFNPFTAKCSRRKIPTKFPNFIFLNFEKQIASCESTDRELSFEWSHHRISSPYKTPSNTLAVKGLNFDKFHDTAPLT